MYICNIVIDRFSRTRGMAKAVPGYIIHQITPVDPKGPV